VTQRLFRKVSLERMSSPEQLDLMIQITTPKGWLALIALGCLLLTGLAWGIWGRIPTKVMGQGILLKTGGILEIVASGAGRVKGIYCDEDDLVVKGQTIARIAQPDIIDKISAKRENLRALETKLAQLSQYYEENTRLERRSRAMERDTLEKEADILRGRMRWLQEKMKNQKELLERGLITKEKLINTRKDFTSSRQEIEKIKNQIQQLDIKDLDLENRKKQEIRTVENQIKKAQMGFRAFQRQKDTAGVVTSPYSGRVIEVDTEPGKIVTRGTPLARIEPVGKHLKEFEAVLFFSPADGKRIRNGMIAHVSPSTVEREKFGNMLAIVTKISRFPASPEGMMRLLHNEGLVRTLSTEGAPVEVRADFIPDPDTPSGVRWSTSTGPPMPIESGTMCTGEVTVSEEPPISLVIPLFKKYVLGVGQNLN